MIVIADTSPFHYLVLLEHAEVLQHLYGRVIIPKAVVLELKRRERRLASGSGWQVRHPGSK
jgi:predicted nucleic acid-binding protein